MRTSGLKRAKTAPVSEVARAALSLLKQAANGARGPAQRERVVRELFDTPQGDAALAALEKRLGLVVVDAEEYRQLTGG